MGTNRLPGAAGHEFDVEWDKGWALLFATFFATLVFVFAADLVHEVNEGQEHGDDDAADDHGEEDDHDRFEEGGHGGHGIVHFFVVVIGDFEKHFREGASLFADVDHADDHGREDAAGFERG